MDGQWVAEAAGTVPSELNRQATAPAGTARSAPHLRGGTGRGAVRSAAPVAHDAEIVALQGRVVESPCRANQAARGVGAASPPRFCLISGTPPRHSCASGSNTATESPPGEHTTAECGVRGAASLRDSRSA
jgi:hypothetical protein